MTPEDLVGLLAEPARLRLLSAVALGARTDEQAATAAGLTGRDAAAARRRLVDAGVVVHGPQAGWSTTRRCAGPPATAGPPRRPSGGARCSTTSPRRRSRSRSGTPSRRSTTRRSLVEGGHLVRGGGVYALPSADPPPKGVGERYVAGLGLR